MTDFVDALSSYRRKISGFVSEKTDAFRDWVELTRRKNAFRRWLRIRRDYVEDKLGVYGKAYTKYFLVEFSPYVLAYGLMINVPVSVLLGWGFTWETVVSWGLVFYFVDEELTSIANELKPYIRLNAKVDK